VKVRQVIGPPIVTFPLDKENALAEDIPLLNETDPVVFILIAQLRAAVAALIVAGEAIDNILVVALVLVIDPLPEILKPSVPNVRVAALLIDKLTERAVEVLSIVSTIFIPDIVREVPLVITNPAVAKLALLVIYNLSVDVGVVALVDASATIKVVPAAVVPPPLIVYDPMPVVEFALVLLVIVPFNTIAVVVLYIYSLDPVASLPPASAVILKFEVLVTWPITLLGALGNQLVVLLRDTEEEELASMQR